MDDILRTGERLDQWLIEGANSEFTQKHLGAGTPNGFVITVALDHLAKKWIDPTLSRHARGPEDFTPFEDGLLEYGLRMAIVGFLLGTVGRPQLRDKGQN